MDFVLCTGHGQESQKNTDLGDKFLLQPNTGFSKVSVVQM